MQELSKLLDSPTLLLNHKLELISSSRHFQSAPYMALLPVIQHALTALPATRSTQSLSLVADADSPCRNVAVHPIQTYQPQGFLISFIDNPPTNKHPLMAMEQAANVISFEMLKQQAVKERSRRYKNEFFFGFGGRVRNLRTGSDSSGKKIRSKRTQHLFVYRSQKKDAPAESNGINPASLEDSRFTEREELYQLIKKGFTDHGTPFVIFTKNDLFVVILSYNPNEPYLQETEMELAELLKKRLPMRSIRGLRLPSPSELVIPCKSSWIFPSPTKKRSMPCKPDISVRKGCLSNSITLKNWRIYYEWFP